jgi:hypothetical protein
MSMARCTLPLPVGGSVTFRFGGLSGVITPNPKSRASLLISGSPGLFAAQRPLGEKPLVFAGYNTRSKAPDPATHGLAITDGESTALVRLNVIGDAATLVVLAPDSWEFAEVAA